MRLNEKEKILALKEEEIGLIKNELGSPTKKNKAESLEIQLNNANHLLNIKDNEIESLGKKEGILKQENESLMGKVKKIEEDIRRYEDWNFN